MNMYQLPQKLSFDRGSKHRNADCTAMKYTHKNSKYSKSQLQTEGGKTVLFHSIQIDFQEDFQLQTFSDLQNIISFAHNV